LTEKNFARDSRSSVVPGHEKGSDLKGSEQTHIFLDKGRETGGQGADNPRVSGLSFGDLRREKMGRGGKGRG